ncbi:unnamed protein product [Phytomonas sp. Hart1]|nr:unnamed protein product [Phytomonas sp. Hart1]|eukprot:CCW68930.1 unnamed protein product [Phytomonas sp. isolate Hart1]
MRDDLVRAVERVMGSSTKSEGEGDWVSFTTFAPAPTRNPTDERERKAWELRPQSLYYRINCLDCLDRTNIAQALLVDAMLPYLLSSLLNEGENNNNKEEKGQTPPFSDSPFERRLREEASEGIRALFAEQGVAISIMYSNVGAHFIPYLLGGHNGRYRPSLKEGMISLRRWFSQNFRDGWKQDEISLITRQHDPGQFSCNIESPFSRDLTGMNLWVLYGIFASLVPLLCCIFFAFFSVDQGEVRLHGAIAVLWIAYFFFIYQKLSKYCVTYTNQALLNHSI